MKETLNAIYSGFREILTWHTMRYALISGAIVALIWAVIGFFAWDILVGLSTSFIELLPFKIIRSDGASMLSAFIWIQLVLVTFAFIYIFIGNFILRSLDRDKYTAFTILTIFGTSLFWAVVWFFMHDYIHAQLVNFLSTLPFETIKKGFASLMAFYFIYNGVVMTMVFFASFFSAPLMRAIEEKNGTEANLVQTNRFRSMKYTLKDSLIFTALVIVLFPLVFIPVIDMFVQLALWSWFIKNTMSYDAASLVYEEKQEEEIAKHKPAVWFISFVTVLFNFLPIFNIFGPFFGEIAMFRYFKNIKEAQKEAE
ncbi:MAG: hypothetical protein COB07_04615 [Sulfurovum sp.]|nr:MAG: hypothetical protein COB07_04615 [Sulfurovum sp.]